MAANNDSGDRPKEGAGQQALPPPRYRGPRSGRLLFFCLLGLFLGFFSAGRFRTLFTDFGPAQRRFEVMGTFAAITVPEGSGAQGDRGEAAGLAEAAVREVNDLMGPFGPLSDVRRLNEAAAGEWVEVSPATWTVVMEALRWHRLTDGAFDPTIGPVKNLFVFDQREIDAWPDEAALADARSRVGADKLLFEREGMRLAWARDGMRLDLGAIAKGYAVDRAAGELRRVGVENALVEVGGELWAMGFKPGETPSDWRAGIMNPRGDDVIERLSLRSAAVATSGDYERFLVHDGRRYEHIIDPRSGLPLSEGPASVTVVHPDSCLAADALATTLCVLGVDAGRKFLEEQALGLFNRGVRVIMYVPLDAGGALRRIEYVVDARGVLTADESVVEPGTTR